VIDASAASLDLHYFLLVISSSIASFGLGLCATLAVASKQRATDVATGNIEPFIFIVHIHNSRS
jgi:hypothetical protein